MQEACRTIQFPSFSDKMASVLLSIYGVSSAVTCCLVHCTADRKSPCLQHPGVQLHPFLLVTAWTLLAPIWCAKTKRVHGHCLTPHTPLKRGGLEATEHQLLWCDSGWHRSTEMGQIITFPIPCQESKCNLLLLAKTGVILICFWSLLQKQWSSWESDNTVFNPTPLRLSNYRKHVCGICLRPPLKKTEKLHSIESAGTSLFKKILKCHQLLSNPRWTDHRWSESLFFTNTGHSQNITTSRCLMADH